MSSSSSSRSRRRSSKSSKSRSRSRRAANEACRDASGQFAPCRTTGSSSRRRRSSSRSRRSSGGGGASLARAEKQVEKEFRQQTVATQAATQANALRPILLEQQAQIWQNNARVSIAQAEALRAANVERARMLAEAKARADRVAADVADALAKVAPPAAAAAPAVAGAVGAPNVLVEINDFDVPATLVPGPAPLPGYVNVLFPNGATPIPVPVRDVTPLVGGVGGLGLLGLGGAPLAGGMLGGMGPLGLLGPRSGRRGSSRSRRSASRSHGGGRGLSAAQARNVARLRLQSNPLLQAAVLSEPCDTNEFDDCDDLLDAAEGAGSSYFG